MSAGKVDLVGAMNATQETREARPLVLELLELAKKAVDETEDSTKYDHDEDEVGCRACCGEISYRPHARDCWVPKMRELLARVQP